MADDELAGYRVVARQCDPLSARLASRGVTHARVMLLTIPVLAGSFAAANFVQRTLWHPGGSSIMASDMLVVLRRSEPRVVSTYFPLMRDYPTLLLFVLVGLWLTILFRQWRLMEDFLPSMLRSGAIEIVAGRESFVRNEIAHANETLVRMRQQSRYIIGAVVLTACVLFAQTRTGIFGLFAPPTADGEWAKEAYRNWWGSLEHPPGFAVYYSAVGVAMYYLLRQNRVGIAWVYLFWRLRGSLNGHVDLTNHDRWYGWKPFRQLIYTVYLSMTATAVGLVALLLVVSMEQWYWLSAFVIVFLILSPFYLAPPLVWVWRALDADKAELSKRVNEECWTLTRRRGPDDSARLAELHTMLQMIHEAKRLPFRATNVVSGLIVYALPVAMALASLLTIDR